MAANELHLSVTRHIRQRRGRVFGFMFDPRNFHFWMAGFQQRVPLVPHYDGIVGAKAIHVRRHKGMTLTFEEVIERVDTDYGFGISLHHEDLLLRFDYQLQDTADGGTMVAVQGQAQLRGLLFSTLRRVFASVLEQQLHSDLDELAALLDEQT